MIPCYHKIQSLFKRDKVTNRFIEGDWSIPEFQYLQSNEWEWTEKIDGTNIRIGLEGDQVIFGGRTDNAQLPAPLVNRLKERFPNADALRQIAQSDIVLFGEGYGAGIQKGGCYSATQDFILFDVKVGDWWLNRSDVCDIANRLGLTWVPTVGVGTLNDAIEKMKIGMKSCWGDFMAEGIVARPTVPLFARNGERIIAKVKYKDFH